MRSRPAASEAPAEARAPEVTNGGDRDRYERLDPEARAPESEREARVARAERAERRAQRERLEATAADAEEQRGALEAFGATFHLTHFQRAADELADVRDEAAEAQRELDLDAGRDQIASESEDAPEEIDLSVIGRGLDPRVTPPQGVWTEEGVNLFTSEGRRQGGLKDDEAQSNAELTAEVFGALDETSEGKKTEFQPADLAVLAKQSGLSLEKLDPNQLVQATHYVNEATTSAEQQDRVRKTLDNFRVLENIGMPKLSRQQMTNELWAMAKVPGHAIGKMSDAKLAETFRDVAARVNGGPGTSEMKIGSHNLKITVGASGQVTQSSCKKPGFFSRLGGVVKAALTVASFIPGPIGVVARVANGVIAAVNAIKNRNWMGAIGAAAAAFGAGAARFGGQALAGAARVANGVAQTVRGVQSVQRGGWSAIIGGAAGIAGGIAQTIGGGAQHFADAMNKVADRIQPLGSVEAIRNADRAKQRAEAALEEAQASGDPRAIAAAKEQLADAERARRSALFGGLSSVATLGAGLSHGSARLGFETAARSFDVARGINDHDLISAGAAAFGMAANLHRGTNPLTIDTEHGKEERFDPWMAASELADAANGYRLSSRAASSAHRAVDDAERALRAARASRDPRAIDDATKRLAEARRAASDADLGRFYAQNAAGSTVDHVYQSRRETQRFDAEMERKAELAKEGTEKARYELGDLLRDPRAQGGLKDLGMDALVDLEMKKSALDEAVASKDPDKIRQATADLEEARVQVEQRTRLLGHVFAPPAYDVRPATADDMMKELEEKRHKFELMLDEIHSHPKYLAMKADDKKRLDESMDIAAGRLNPDYYSEKMLLLLNTEKAPEEKFAEQKNETIDQAVDAAEERLATPEGHANEKLEESISADPSRSWTVLLGDDATYRVDRSDPNNVVVQMNVHLNGKKEDVERVQKLEDDIEKQAGTDGYTFDLNFVTRSGRDVFDAKVDLRGWSDSGNWSDNAYTLAHEAHHRLRLEDRYDYIESHAGNANMDLGDRLYWYWRQMQKAPDPMGSSSLMGGGYKPLDDDICRVIQADLEACLRARRH